MGLNSVTRDKTNEKVVSEKSNPIPIQNVF